MDQSASLHPNLIPSVFLESVEATAIAFSEAMCNRFTWSIGVVQPPSGLLRRAVL